MPILLVEDDERLASAVVAALRGDGHDVVHARDVATGRLELARSRPALVLLDLMLPDGSGYDLLDELRKRSDVPVIVLTARGLGEDKVKALDLGADDYLVKPFWTPELLARIRAVLRRPRLLEDDALITFGNVRVDLVSRVVRVDGEPVHLTPTEFDLLAFFVRRQGEALRRERIMEAVLREGEVASTVTLQALVSRVRSKLGEDGRRIQTVWGVGYRFDR